MSERFKKGDEVTIDISPFIEKMRKKRFMLDDAGEVIDLHTPRFIEYGKEIVDLLNELDEKYVDEFSLRETLQLDLQRVEEENENLRDVNAQCCNDYSAMRRDVLRYKEENEQLKKDKDDLIDYIKKAFPKSYKHILEGFE